ncbi:MAG: ECF transporter S component [Oscillospiraceae bacterium]|nr:ECF transporter S component [Oscillospiraceae bacterium]MBQ4601081.1 ECF transporter S component [Oscillospiraceae bacterium]
MTALTPVKRLSLCAMFIALCYVIPLAFHPFGLGTVLSPMHIPVLLCGSICGGGAGFLCGILGPVLSSLLSGMPPVLKLIRMIPELSIYGLAAGLAMRAFRTGHTLADLYISLIIAMLAGRIAGGIATAVFYAATSGVYSLSLWATGYFVEGLPGIACQLLLVPTLVFALEKARLIPPRYPKTLD